MTSRVIRRVCIGGALLAPALNASAQSQLWIRQFGTSGDDSMRAVAADGTGGIFVTGMTTGSLAAPNVGSYDIWLARYDGAGTQTWIREFGSNADDVAWAVAVDGVGGIFVAGRTNGSLGGANAGSSDAWLAHYDAAGNQAWVRQFGTSSYDEAEAIAADGNGGAFVAGRTFGSLGGPLAGTYDAWVACYDAAGTQSWIRQFGTSDNDGATVAAADGIGGVFVGGVTRGSLAAPNVGSYDIWLARYDGAGTQTWIRQFGSSNHEAVWAIARDGAGEFFIAGQAYGNFGGPNAGSSDAWVARCDAAGAPIWIRQFGTRDYDYATSLASDGEDGVFVGGYSDGNLGGSHAGSLDAWVARYDAAGTPTWIRQFGTSGSEAVHACVADGVGGVFVGGDTSGNLGGPNAGTEDVWLLRFSRGCYANCDGSTTAPVLAIDDFGCFLQKFITSNPYANCDGSTTPPTLNVADFSCFLQKYAAGCP